MEATDVLNIVAKWHEGSHVKVYILYIPTSACVQYVHIYTVYSAAGPSFVVKLYSASVSCFIDTAEIQL